MSHDFPELREWLRQRGDSEADIERTLRRVQTYDSLSVRQAVFDSIHSGQFNLDQIIADAQKTEP